MKYFIASRWQNMKKVQTLTENLKNLGNTVFSYVPDERNFVPERELEAGLEMFKKIKNWRQDNKLRNIFEKSLAGLEDSDAVILLLPAGKTSHIEAGIGYGLGKHMILIGEPESAEPHYLVFDTWYKTIEEFVSALRSK